MKGSIKSKIIVGIDLSIASNSNDLDYKKKCGVLKKQGKLKNWKTKYLELDGLTLKCFEPKKIKPMVIPLHKIISLEEGKDFRMKVSTLSEEVIFQGKNNIDRDNWKKAIEYNITTGYIDTRYFIIIGPVVMLDEKKNFYMLKGDQIITVKETMVNNILSKYVFEYENIKKVDHQELIEPFSFHQEIFQSWASSIRHNNNIYIEEPIYSLFKQTLRVNNVPKHIVLSSHYLRIFHRADDLEPEVTLSIAKINLLEQCQTGTIEILYDVDRYILSSGDNTLILYGMLCHNKELGSQIKHTFSSDNFARNYVEYNDAYLWMEVVENCIYLFNSPESTTPRNAISYRNVQLIEKSASLKGIFEQNVNTNREKNINKRYYHTISEGKFKTDLFKDESCIPSTFILHVKYPNNSVYLKVEVTENILKKLLISFEKGLLEYKEHLVINKESDVLGTRDNETPNSARLRTSTQLHLRNNKALIYPSSFVETDVGGKRENEDTFCNLDIFVEFNSIKYSFYGLYDGHGGGECSQVAKEIIHQKVKETEEFEKGEVLLALEKGFEQTEIHITTLSAKNKWESGTTAACVILTEDSKGVKNLYIANIGDTEAILVKEKEGIEKPINKGSLESIYNPVIKNIGELNNSSEMEKSLTTLTLQVSTHDYTLLTEKHTPQSEKEKERVERAEGMVIRDRIMGRIAVARSFGDIPFKHPYNQAPDHWVSPKPYLLHVPLDPLHKFIIIACDGLWDVISYQRATDLAANYLSKNMNPQQVCRFLVTAAIEAGSLDNITVSLILLNPM